MSAGKCDFCSEEGPAWIYPCDKFAMEQYGWGSTGGWAACEDCSDLIERRKDRELAVKCLSAYPAVQQIAAELGYMLTRAERRELLSEVETLHNRFRRSRRGARRLFG